MSGAGEMNEMLAQVIWLESCGWTAGEDGLWRHPAKAPQEGLTHTAAFVVERRFPGTPPDDPGAPVNSL